MKTVKEIEECADRLLRADKPKRIVGVFNSKEDLSEQQARHFTTAEYIWNLTPQTIEGPYKDKFMGLLLDEKLDYVHIVFGSQKFLDYITISKNGINP